MVATILGPVLLVFFFLFVIVAGIGLSIWGVVDAATRPDGAWASAQQSKVLWIVLLIVPIFVFAPLSCVLAIVYLTAIRPKVRAAQLAGPATFGSLGATTSLCLSCGSPVAEPRGRYCASCGASL